MDTVQNSNNCCQCTYNSTDNEKVLKRFSYLASLYTYLKRHFHVSRILLFRNLSYIRENRIRYQESSKHETSLNDICDKLLINKTESQLFLNNKPNFIYNLKFNGFYDGDSECEWETIHASASVIVVHQWKNRRKNKCGSKSIELLSNISFKCNNNFVVLDESGLDDSFELTKDKLFQDTSQFRISYSYILFKIKAFERKKRSQHAYSDVNGKLEESARVFPVNYETRFPIYKRDSDRYQADAPDGSCDYLVDGEYELRLDVSQDQPNEDFANSMTTNQLANRSLAKPLTSIHDSSNNGHTSNNNASMNGVTSEKIKTDNNHDDNDDFDDDDDYDDDDSTILDSFDKSLPVWVSETYTNNTTNNPSNIKVKEYSKWPKIKFTIATSHIAEIETEKTYDEKALSNSDADKGHSHQNGVANGLNNQLYSEHIIKTINGVLKSLEEENNDGVNHSRQMNGCISKLNNLKRKKMKPLTVITNSFFSNASHRSVQDHSTLTVAYKMMNKDRLIQWTHSKGLKCPWCGFNRFNSIRIDYGIHCLLKHLRTFHARFSYHCYINSHPSVNTPNTTSQTDLNKSTSTQHHHPSSYTIEIRLNDSYDGSVEVGMRQYTNQVHLDLYNQPHHYSSIQRRQNFTQLIYSKIIFQPVADKVQGLCADLKPVAHGHNREYFHSATGLTQMVLDLETDSEAEDIPQWLEYQYSKRLEEFMDVNPGEKRVMQLWNEHLLKFKYHGDYALPNLLKLFIQTKGEILKEEKLRNNLILHLSNLVDYGLLSADQFLDAIGKYDSL